MGEVGAMVLRRGRSLIVLGAAVLCGLTLGAAKAGAASMTTNCAGLQAALDQAQNGDVITLDQLCTAGNSGTSGFNLDSGTHASYTLQGQPGSGAGFDGTGVTGSLLWAEGGNSPLATLTINNLVFQNASPTSPANGGGGALSIGGGNYAVSLDHDTFNNNTVASGAPGGAIYLAPESSSGSIAITNSSFSGNHAAQSGGALYIQEQTYPTGPPVNLADDTFTSNAVTGPSPGTISGGAVDLNNTYGGVGQLTQTDNTFTNNSVSGATDDAYGGAETTTGVNDSFTGDKYTGNSIQAPAGISYSEGSALAIFNESCTQTLSHVLTDEAIAGNSIADGGANPANAWGALYVGCSSYTGNNLTLIDSTISGNRGGGGTAGIWGDPGDQLTLKNSILNGDTDGSELFGFNGTGGSLSVSYSDLCNGSSPQAGTGNICANPNLANAGGGDVHETYGSPTIDVGSNALVPSGLSTDVYGQPRIQPKLPGGQAVVDMGAAEYPTVQPPTVTITVPSAGALYVQGQVVHSSFTCHEGSGGPGISSCTDPGQPSGSPIDTSTPGKHTFTVTAQSADGLSTTASIAYTVAGPPTVKIKTPAHRTYYQHAKVHSSFTCTEGPSGPGIASCKDGSGHNSGALINTAKLGVHRFTVTARSRDGQVSSATVTYTVRRRPRAHRAAVHRRRPAPRFTG